MTFDLISDDCFPPLFYFIGPWFLSSEALLLVLICNFHESIWSTSVIEYSFCLISLYCINPILLGDPNKSSLSFDYYLLRISLSSLRMVDAVSSNNDDEILLWLVFFYKHFYFNAYCLLLISSSSLKIPKPTLKKKNTIVKPIVIKPTKSQVLLYPILSYIYPPIIGANTIPIE